MKIVLHLSLIVLFISSGFLFAGPAKEWVVESDRHTKVLLEIMAKYNPESAAYFGLEGLDENIFDVKPDFTEREKTDYLQAKKELENRLQKATVPEVRQDLNILISAVDDQIRNQELDEKYFLPYFNISQTIFYSIKALLDDQVSGDRYPAALIRLKKYTGMMEGFTPVCELLQDHISQKLKDTNLLGPARAQMERDLKNTPQFIAGTRELFEKFQVPDYQQALGNLEKQIGKYEAFLREKVLPRARTEFRLPEEIYRNNLKQFGIDMPVEEMVRRAKVSFRSLQNDMTSLGVMIAAKRGWNTTDYREVLKNLKEEQIIGEEILPLYKNRIRELEDIARKQKIVSIPERDLRIRLASEAESAGIPAPHMQPPRLINNTGEMGEFVLPLKFPGEDMTIDDFTHESTTWTLAVHEGRPGHEMQFASLVENGVSQARAIYAFNSVNAEGWALYMEAEMKPYLPLEGQFGALFALMIRSARAFLDPGLQMGLITIDEANYVLKHEVGLSPALALQEIERYTFRSPGQATSYFCGFQRLMELRADAELALGQKFNRKTFHDFILAQGLIPPSLMRQAVMEKFVPKYLDAENN